MVLSIARIIAGRRLKKPNSAYIEMCNNYPRDFAKDIASAQFSVQIQCLSKSFNQVPSTIFRNDKLQAIKIKSACLQGDLKKHLLSSNLRKV